MNIRQRKEVPFGDFSTAACQVWGSRSARKEGAIGDQCAPGGISRTAAFVDFLREGEVCMNKSNVVVDRIKIGLVIVLSAALLAALLGCVG